MKINVERLISVVQEFFDNYESYEKYCKIPYSKRDESWKSDYRYYERNYEVRNYCLSDLCEILNFDRTRLECIAKLVRRWESRHGWQKCFPIKEHGDKIISYISK
jgi:hypothetical protein